MKIVVIGGTGLIGSKVVEKLKQKGHEAIAAAPGPGPMVSFARSGFDVPWSPAYQSLLEFGRRFGKVVVPDRSLPYLRMRLDRRVCAVRPATT